MPKFFIKKEDIEKNTVTVTGQDATHISKVLRHTVGDKLTLCDGEGTDFSAEITECTKESVTLKITDTIPCLVEPKISVTLFQGLPKQGKMDYIIEKCTELGITRIVPVAMKRSVAKIEDKKSETKKLERWRKIAAESVKQCGRGKIPEITEVMTVDEAIKFSDNLDLTLAAYENEQEVSLRSVLKSHTPESIGVFIGPEGGLDDKEIEKFKSKNIPSVTLGKRILRTETAGHTVLTTIMYEYNEFE